MLLNLMQSKNRVGLSLAFLILLGTGCAPIIEEEGFSDTITIGNQLIKCYNTYCDSCIKKFKSTTKAIKEYEENTNKELEGISFSDKKEQEYRNMWLNAITKMRKKDHNIDWANLEFVSVEKESHKRTKIGNGVYKEFIMLSMKAGKSNYQQIIEVMKWKNNYYLLSLGKFESDLESKLHSELTLNDE